MGGIAPDGGGSVVAEAGLGATPYGAPPGITVDPSGRLKSGEDGPKPPGGVTPGPVPVFADGPGPVRCAEAGAAIANAAIIAMPLKRCLMSLVLCYVILDR